MDDQALVIRKGKFRYEFLLVRSFFKKFVGSQAVGHALVFEPRGLSKGRTGWEALTGVTDVVPLLRTQGAQGIVIQALSATGRGTTSVLEQRPCRVRRRSAAICPGWPEFIILSTETRTESPSRSPRPKLPRESRPEN